MDCCDYVVCNEVLKCPCNGLLPVAMLYVICHCLCEDARPSTQDVRCLLQTCYFEV